MRAGRKPQPTKLKLLKGENRTERLNKNEPTPIPGAPDCPEWLSPLARAEWHRVVPQLLELGLLTKLDMVALAAYCQAYSRYVDAERSMTEHGVKREYGEKGYEQTSADMSVAHKYLAVIKAFCAEFGLTPSSRARMVVPGHGDDDDFAEFVEASK